MISFMDDSDLDTTTRITYGVDTSMTGYTAITVGRLLREGRIFIQNVYTSELHVRAVEVPPKNWRPWHELANFGEPPLPRYMEPAARALLRRQERWPRVEAAARKRRRFLQELRV